MDRTRTVVLYVVLAIFTGSQILGACSDYRRNLAAEQREEVALCLGAYRVKYLDGPEARSLKSLALFGVDSREFAVAVDSYNADLFEDLNRLARDDPRRFVRECREANP